MLYISEKGRFIAVFLIVWIFTSFLSANILPAKDAQAATDYCVNCGTEITQFGKWIADKIWQAKEYAMSSLRNASLAIISGVQVWDKADTLLQRALKLAWNNIKRQMLNELTSDVLNWTRNEESGYVYDWRGFLAQEADREAQRFLSDEVDKAPMYENYASAVRQDVRSIDEYYERKTFSQKVGGPISQEEMSAFYNGDFTWDRWDAALQSNYYMDYFTALDDLAMTKESTYDAKKSQLQASQGYRGTADTPGPVIANAANRASMMDFDYLLQADDINEFLSNTVDAFINRIAKKGFKNADFVDYQPSGEPPQVSVPSQTLDYAYLESRLEPTQNLTKLLWLVKENLQTRLDEQIAGQTAAQQIKGIQDDIVAKSQTQGGCQLATAPIDAELTAIKQAIAGTEAEIRLADKAATYNTNLVGIMEQAIAANAAGDTGGRDLAMAEFKTIHQNETAVLKALLGTEETDLQRLYDLINQYSIQVVVETYRYTDARGYPQLGTGLYGRKAQEQNQLNACLTLINQYPYQNYIPMP